MVAVKRTVFFVVSSIIIALLVKWGFDGFEVFTKIYPASELIDGATGRVIVQTKSSYKLGLDMVFVIAIGLSALGFIVINFFKIYYASKED
jgi:hypothetical protein